MLNKKNIITSAIIPAILLSAVPSISSAGSDIEYSKGRGLLGDIFENMSRRSQKKKNARETIESRTSCADGSKYEARPRDGQIKDPEGSNACLDKMKLETSALYIDYTEHLNRGIMAREQRSFTEKLQRNFVSCEKLFKLDIRNNFKLSAAQKVSEQNINCLTSIYHDMKQNFVGDKKLNLRAEGLYLENLELERKITFAKKSEHKR